MAVRVVSYGNGWTVILPAKVFYHVMAALALGVLPSHVPDVVATTEL